MVPRFVLMFLTCQWGCTYSRHKARKINHKLLLLAAGNTLGARTSNKCASGETKQCCQTVARDNSSNADKNFLFGLLSIVFNKAVQSLGVGCDMMGIGGTVTTCASQTVCCSGSAHGTVVIGCIPIAA